ncbi:MAG: peptidylprolyl isomerase, partial [Deltaproteobacteria bacterium]|nr:peptidylprolyl isomerase [Deltaproteobacteria bacterium]
MNKKHFWLILIFIIMAGCATFKANEFAKKYGLMQTETIDRTVDTMAPGEVAFYADVQPILEKRCDVCHSCYDAPCQMKLTSFEGLERGGSRTLVYNSARLKRDIPTRLFV